MLVVSRPPKLLGEAAWAVAELVAIGGAVVVLQFICWGAWFMR